jgi:hypothetical protein
LIIRLTLTDKWRLKTKTKDEGKTEREREREREREARVHARAVECVSAKAVLPRLLAGSKAACNLGWLADCAAG